MLKRDKWTALDKGRWIHSWVSVGDGRFAHSSRPPDSPYRQSSQLRHIGLRSIPTCCRAQIAGSITDPNPLAFNALASTVISRPGFWPWLAKRLVQKSKLLLQIMSCSKLKNQMMASSFFLPNWSHICCLICKKENAKARKSKISSIKKTENSKQLSLLDSTLQDSKSVKLSEVDSLSQNKRKRKKKKKKRKEKK